MPAKSSEEMLEVLFNEINNIIMPMNPSNPTAPPAGFVTMAVPGTTVNSADFDPNTPAGRENLYAYMDRLPAVDKRYVDSAKRCSDLYGQILSAATPDDDPEAAAAKEKAYQDALSFLTDDVVDAYEDYEDEYYDARDELFSLMNDPDASEGDRKKAQRASDRAWKHWTTKGLKQKVEEAFNVCSAYLLCTPKSFFAQAGKTFEECKDPTTGLRPVVCTPSIWATDPSKLSWANVTVTHNSSVSKVSDYTKQVDESFSADFKMGLWSASASGGYHDRVHKLNASSTVDNLGMSFDIARVDLRRDWFMGSLLTYPGTKIPGYDRGALCSGSLETAASCTFPFLPTSFVVARNINLYNTFTSEEEALFEESTSWSLDAKVGYGPFSISSNTSVSTDLSEDEKKQFGDAIKVSVGEGMQIIGFVNTILTPAFPAASSVNDLLLGRESLRHGPRLLSRIAR